MVNRGQQKPTPYRQRQKQKQRLQVLVNRGAVVRQWMNHPGAKIMFEEIDALSGKQHTRWLLASDEEAEEIRKDASSYQRFWELVKKVILDGDNARNTLAALDNSEAK